MNKYFLKQQLAWIPVLGIADMPFMKRYSRAYLFAIPNDMAKISILRVVLA
jgi:hypothetical protein